MYIIVAGNLSDGFLFIGPFENFDDAADYAQREVENDSWVAKLHSPETNNV